MVSPNDINPNEFVKELATALKDMPEVRSPVWASFVKTGHYKERPPMRSDWWHIRAAAVMRSVYKLGPVGTSKLRTKYGGKKNRGMAAEHYYKGSGSIIRMILQQLEKAGLVIQAAKGVHKGRVVTPKGKSLLNSVAKKLSPPSPISYAKAKPEAKPDTKEAKKFLKKTKDSKDGKESSKDKAASEIALDKVEKVEKVDKVGKEQVEQTQSA